MLRRRKVLVITTIVVAVLAGFLITPHRPAYTAQAQLYVGLQSPDLNPTSGQISNDRLTGLSFLANTYAHMIQTRTVAERALAQTGVPRTIQTAQAEITAAAEVQTQLVTITVVDGDPAVAQSLANGVADSFVDLVKDQERLQASATDSSDHVPPVSVFEHAALPTTPAPSGLVRNLTLATMFGLLVAVGLVTLLEYLDLTIRSADDAQQRLQLRVLGAIPLDPVNAGA